MPVFRRREGPLGSVFSPLTLVPEFFVDVQAKPRFRLHYATLIFLQYDEKTTLIRMD